MDINKMILNGAYDVGPHARQRASENKINLGYAIQALATTAKPERTFSPQGEAWIFDKQLKNGKTLRMVVGPNRNDKNKLFIVTLFVRENDGIRSHHSKFGGEVVYEFG